MPQESDIPTVEPDGRTCNVKMRIGSPKIGTREITIVLLVRLQISGWFDDNYPGTRSNWELMARKGTQPNQVDTRDPGNMATMPTAASMDIAFGSRCSTQ